VKAALLVGAASAGLGRCSSHSPDHAVSERNAALMGTIVTVKVRHPDRELAERAIDAALAELARIEEICSTHGRESEVAAVNASGAGEWCMVGPELAEIATQSLLCSRLSGGAYDITVGPLVELWGFEQGGGVVPTPEEIARRRALVDFRSLEVDTSERRMRLARSGMALDLGGGAKGYGVDRAMSVLRDHGITAALVDAGGDLRAMGTRTDGTPWRIGLKHPRGPGAILAVFELEDGSVATSGDYERYFFHEGVRYHHILDPHTGEPAREAVSATVWAEDAVTADIFATALFVLGPRAGIDMLEELEGLEGLVVTEGGAGLVAWLSSGLAGKVEFVEPVEIVCRTAAHAGGEER
jgi:thiamine biosynthesis lipoprotein